jgi:hypothetical protein
LCNWLLILLHIFRYLRFNSSPSNSWILFGSSGSSTRGINQLLDVRIIIVVSTSIRMACYQLSTIRR